MSTRFDVTPEELKNSASKINVIANEWKKEVDSIYAAVDELNVSYKGEASAKFNEHLQGYVNDFQAAITALNNYIEFLNTYSSEIHRTEKDLEQQAAQLSVGH